MLQDGMTLHALVQMDSEAGVVKAGAAFVEHPPYLQSESVIVSYARYYSSRLARTLVPISNQDYSFLLIHTLLPFNQRRNPLLYDHSCNIIAPE
jgi:hypothetical protein